MKRIKSKTIRVDVSGWPVVGCAVVLSLVCGLTLSKVDWGGGEGITEWAAVMVSAVSATATLLAIMFAWAGSQGQVQELRAAQLVAALRADQAAVANCHRILARLERENVNNMRRISGRSRSRGVDVDYAVWWHRTVFDANQAIMSICDDIRLHDTVVFPSPGIRAAIDGIVGLMELHDRECAKILNLVRMSNFSDVSDVEYAEASIEHAVRDWINKFSKSCVAIGGDLSVEKGRVGELIAEVTSKGHGSS